MKIEYDIIHEERVNDKYTFDVVLTEKMSGEDLQNICTYLYKSLKVNCTHCFVSFYLPNTHPERDDAWAVGKMTPHFDLKIGLTIANETILRSRLEAGPNTLGSWIDHWGEGALYTLEKEDSNFILSVSHPISSGYKLCVVEEVTDRGRIYSEPNNEYCENYLVSPDGELIISDRDGLIRTLQRIA